jgi:predicted RNA-binding Zn-ribbon protein involved in translation (DUF1610 family)
MFKEFIPSGEYPDDPELRRELYKKDKLFLQEHEGIVLPSTSIKTDFLKTVQELHLADKIQIINKKVRAYENSAEYETDKNINKKPIPKKPILPLEKCLSCKNEFIPKSRKQFYCLTCGSGSQRKKRSINKRSLSPKK